MRKCKHTNVRCIHGDEIISTLRPWRTPTMARVRCLDCGKPLYKLGLPVMCYFSGKPHQMTKDL